MPKPRYHYAIHNKPISLTICQQARLRKAFRKRWFSVKYNGNAKYGEFMVCYWENIKNVGSENMINPTRYRTAL